MFFAIFQKKIYPILPILPKSPPIWPRHPEAPPARAPPSPPWRLRRPPSAPLCATDSFALRVPWTQPSLRAAPTPRAPPTPPTPPTSSLRGILRLRRLHVLLRLRCSADSADSSAIISKIIENESKTIREKEDVPVPIAAPRQEEPRRPASRVERPCLPARPPGPATPPCATLVQKAKPNKIG